MAKQHIGEQIDEICDEFEQAWKQNNAPKLRLYVQRVAVADRDRLMKALVGVDVEYRTRLDTQFEVADYLADLGLKYEDLTGERTITDVQGAGRGTPTRCETFSAMPRRIGKFKLEREVGRGGFGVVYQAFDTVLKRDVALKIPRDALGKNSRLRFVREAEAAAALDHPGVVTVFESGEVDGCCYIASAFCAGQNLAQWIKQQGTVTLRSVAQIVRDSALAMQHAHDRGVIHRDLKPSNIMAVLQSASNESNGDVIAPKITDFGLAKLIEDQLEDTRTSIVLGTPNYMAPEQIIRGCTLPGAACDIYSLGVILYELLTAQRPFERNTFIEVMDAIRHAPVVSPRNLRADIPRDLETICLKCLSKMPADRYDSCQALADDLTSFLSGKPIAARPLGWRCRIRRWVGRPARIQETGLLSVLLGLGVPIWILMVVIFVAIDGLEANIEAELIPQTLGVTAGLLLPLAWIGLKTFDRKRLWIRIGFLASLVNLAMVIPPLFGYIAVFPKLYGQYPLGRIVAYTFLTLLFSVQVIQYGCILRFSTLSDGSDVAHST